MATPQEQARNYHAAQAAAAAAASGNLGALLRSGAPWATILEALARWQLRTATTAVQTFLGYAATTPTEVVDPTRFAGTTSAGYQLHEPIVAAIDRVIPAPVEDLPEAWWDSTADSMAEIMARFERVVENEVRDAGRAAAQTQIVVTPDWQNYMRVLVPPSCKRCAILAGRIYRDLEGFERHPGCDCVHWPIGDGDKPTIKAPEDAWRDGEVRDLTAAEQYALENGADMSQIVNANRGMSVVGVNRRTTITTTEATTKRGLWRKANPSKPIRLHPQAIFDIVRDEYGGDRDQAVRLLKVYGYILPETPTPARPLSP